MKSLKMKYYEIMLKAEIYLFYKLIKSRNAKWFNIVNLMHGAAMVCFGNVVNEVLKGEFLKSFSFFVMFVALLLLTKFLDSYTIYKPK